MSQSESTALTRFNAVRHGVLSRYTVLPWEDADAYEALLSALVDEHAPAGPTEEHLVEELAGVIWRKRRLQMAEASAARRRLAACHASTIIRRFSSWTDCAGRGVRQNCIATGCPRRLAHGGPVPRSWAP